MAKCSPIDPALLEDGVAAFDTYIRNTLTRTECCMPGIVLSFDRISHTALIQPLCDFVTNTGDSVQRKPITMHVWRFACGGKIIDFPMRKGDTGWIIASDYDSFLQKINNSNIDESKNKGSSNPNTAESHSYRHGFFMPDSFCSFTDIDRFGDDLVIGSYSKDGSISSIGDPFWFKYNSIKKRIDGGYLQTLSKIIDSGGSVDDNYKIVGSQLWVPYIYLDNINISLGANKNFFLLCEIRYNRHEYEDNTIRFIPEITFVGNWVNNGTSIYRNYHGYDYSNSVYRFVLYAMKKTDDGYEVTTDYRSSVNYMIPYFGP